MEITATAVLEKKEFYDMYKNIYGLDLGTHEIKVYDKNKDITWKQRNVIALKEKDAFLTIGNKAYEMFGKTPSDIQVISPMKHGAIASFEHMQQLLTTLITDAKLFKRGSDYFVALPTDLTEVEKKAFYDLVLNAPNKAKSVRMVERNMADALGAGVDVFGTKGTVIVNFGGATTELSVLLAGGMVVNRLLKIGGEDFDLATTNYIRRNHDLLIGHSTAEQLRKSFGVSLQDSKSKIRVSGKNILSGLPVKIEIPSHSVETAIKEPLYEIFSAIKAMVGRIPSNIHQEILEHGIILTGGLARMSGLTNEIKSELHLRAHVCEAPEFSVANGIKKIIQNKKTYRKFTYSMIDEDYRWLR